MFVIYVSRETKWAYILKNRKIDTARKQRAINLIFFFLGHSDGTLTLSIFYSFVGLLGFEPKVDCI